jgi:hypothetical protein
VDVAVRPLFYFVMAATGVIIGVASPQLCLRCRVVSGIVRIASRVTRPLHSTLPAGTGARAHGLRAKAGAPFRAILSVQQIGMHMCTALRYLWRLCLYVRGKLLHRIS